MALGKKVAKGTLWVISGSYISQIVNFLSNIALMWLIAPDQFGIMALAVFFLTLAQKLCAFGFNHALIHKQNSLDRAIPTHQFLHLATSLIVLLLLFAAHPLIKGYDSLTAAVVILLAFSNIAQSMGHTPRILMEKELDFAPVIKVNLLSVIAGNFLGILLALFGLGIWALAIRQLFAEIISTIGFFLFSKRKPKFIIDKEMIFWYFKFGAYLWLAGLATLVTLKFDDFLVGTMISSEELGYYARAYAFACLPTTMIAHLVSKVAFPLYSKLQEERDKLSDAFETATGGVLLFTLPAAVGLALLAPEFVMILFGDQWAPMAPLLQWLLIYASFRPLFDNTGELFTAIGKPKIAGLILMAQAGVVLVLCPLMVWKFSAAGAAISVGVAMGLGVLLAYIKLAQYVKISYMRVFLAPAIATGAGAIVTIWTEREIAVKSLFGLFFIKGFVFLAVFAAMIFLFRNYSVLDNGKRFIMLIRNSGEDQK